MPPALGKFHSVCESEQFLKTKEIGHAYCTKKILSGSGRLSGVGAATTIYRVLSVTIEKEPSGLLISN